MKVRFHLSTGMNDCRSEIFDLDDDLTDEEIEEEWRDWKNNYIDSGWEKIDEDNE